MAVNYGRNPYEVGGRDSTIEGYAKKMRDQ